MDERRRADVLSRKVEVHYEQEERTRFEFEEMRAQFEGLKLENQNLKAEQDRSLSDTETNVGVQTHTHTEYVEGVQTHSRNVQVKGSQVQGVQTHLRPDRTEGVQTHSGDRVLERQEYVAKRTDCKSEAVQNTGEAYAQYAYREAERDHGYNQAGYAHGNENISNFQGGQPRGAFLHRGTAGGPPRAFPGQRYMGAGQGPRFPTPIGSQGPPMHGNPLTHGDIDQVVGAIDRLSTQTYRQPPVAGNARVRVPYVHEFSPIECWNRSQGLLQGGQIPTGGQTQAN